LSPVSGEAILDACRRRFREFQINKTSSQIQGNSLASRKIIGISTVINEKEISEDDAFRADAQRNGTAKSLMM